MCLISGANINYIFFQEKYIVSMADNSPQSLIVNKILRPQISEEEAKSRMEKWLAANVLKKKDVCRLGKAVLVYYPFWRYVREDGEETTVICKPAFGTMYTGIQSLSLKDEPVDAGDADIVPPTINASYYYKELHGLPRGEMLVGIPFWLISYKYKNSIYMLKIEAETGEILPEWHPFKDPVNWRKIALLAFIPTGIICVLAVLVHPVFYAVGAAYLLALLWHSKMLAILNTKHKEGLNGS